MTYQVNFPTILPVRPKQTLVGILGQADLGGFVLGRIPSTRPAGATATCPYRPFHVPDDGQQESAVVPATGPVYLPGMPAALVPSLPRNPDAIDLATMAAERPAQPAPSLTSSPYNTSCVTSAPQEPPILTQVAPTQPAPATTSAPGKGVDGAFAYPQEPQVATPSLPARDLTAGSAWPAKLTECK